LCLHEATLAYLQANVHPAIVQLGLRYADGSIVGGNARCVALLHALAQVVRDYSTPEGKSLSRDLTAHLNTMIAFLVECRPLSVSMGELLLGRVLVLVLCWCCAGAGAGAGAVLVCVAGLWVHVLLRLSMGELPLSAALAVALMAC
jgi:hypothetical protein